MKILRRIFWIHFIILLTLPSANAQVNHSDDSGNRYLSLGYSSDAFSAIDMGYSFNPGFAKANDIHVYARISIPLVLSMKDKSFDSWEIDLGLNSNLVDVGDFGLIADIRFFMIHHKQVLGTFLPLGFDMSLTPAYYFSKGYIGLQCKWNQTLATHVKHSDYVKNTFKGIKTEEDILMDIHPEDGWYGFTGSHLGFGLEGGRSIGSRYLINGEMGIIKFSSPYTGMFDAMMMGQVPFYLDLRLFYKL